MPERMHPVTNLLDHQITARARHPAGSEAIFKGEHFS